ncbi:MAG: hypothetical protein R3E48_22670 [Burkholderiaceae bacterium]
MRSGRSGGVALGRVEAVDDFGAPHPVLRVVEDTDGERRVRLIPFVDPVVATVDLERRRIDADWSPDY